MSELGNELRLFLVVVGATFAVALIERRSFWSYGLNGPSVPKRILAGAFWGCCLVSLLIGALLATNHLAIGARAIHEQDTVSYGVIWGATFGVTAVTEEMLFRGYLLVTLARVLRFWPAAIVMSLLFGLVHLTNEGESPLGIANVALAGGVFCSCLRLSGSLWWGIGFHAAWDWALSFVYGAPNSGYEIETSFLQSHPIGDSLWSGGSAGPEGSLISLPILCLAILIAVLTFGLARAR